MNTFGRAFLLVSLLSVTFFAVGSAPPVPVLTEVLSAGPSQGQGLNEKQQRDFMVRWQSIDALITAYHSVASGSGSADQIPAVESRVATLLGQANAFIGRGEYTAATDLLGEAYSVVKLAIVAVHDGHTLVNQREGGSGLASSPEKPKAQQDYQRRSGSVAALLAAYLRIAEEKGERQQAAILEKSVATLEKEAQALTEAQDYTGGSELLNDAYLLVKEALVALRDGDTLVHSLDFSTKEQEYQYYVTKTQSQLTAIRVLRKASGNPAKNRRIDTLLSSAQAKLDKAEQMARSDDYESAVPLMDEAFSQLQSGFMMSLSSR